MEDTEDNLVEESSHSEKDGATSDLDMSADYDSSSPSCSEGNRSSSLAKSLDCETEDTGSRPALCDRGQIPSSPCASESESQEDKENVQAPESPNSNEDTEDTPRWNGPGPGCPPGRGR
ncbi:hypothetical protein FKM82_003787 [Ascaphus truei]